MGIKGIARKDSRTKDLVKRLQPNEIAIIDHCDLDEVAARSLVESKVRAVVNVSPSMSTDYPNQGPLVLVNAGILLLDSMGSRVMTDVEEGQEVEIINNSVYVEGRPLGSGTVLTNDMVRKSMEEVGSRMNEVLAKFAHNTMSYAVNEMGLISGQYKAPEIRTKINGRHVLVVVRGQNYKEDLLAIKTYVNELRPVLVGVDGGADALREFGYLPDIIVGDMDSVSDDTLRSGAELVVHAYKDGQAPGMERLRQLGLKGIKFAAPGTSEDIAMLMAYEKGADLIVAVGTHSNMMDFLEKGRKGMASTFLVRLKVGSILVDARGVGKLYKTRFKARHVAQLVLAALLPVVVVIIFSPATRELLRLLYINWRALVGL